MNPRMNYTGDGIQFTERHEGYQSKAYRDSGGIWTCGYGHTEGVSPSTTCTPALAEEWLKQDVTNAMNGVNNLVKVPLTQNQFNALVDFTFNVGVNAFSRSTMLILINQNQLNEAADQFERWDLCKGQVIAGLLRRRQDEKAEFNQPDGEIS